MENIRKKGKPRHCGEKRRTFSPPSLSEQTDIIVPVSTEQATESTPTGIFSSAVENISPKRQPGRRKRKDTVSHVPPTGPESILTSAWKK